jgi:DNA-directed RNA polymerase specialized sigma24 family protein
MTPLDQRLYAWLAEPDDRRFERAFNAYFQVAYPALLRRLSRLSRWDAAQLEELAQDALIRFFDRIGRSRRQAANVIRGALAALQPLPLGPLHERQVLRWKSEVTDFHGQATHFRPGDSVDDAIWKGQIRSHADRIPTLQSQGHQLILSVRLHLVPAEAASSTDPATVESTSTQVERFVLQFQAAADAACTHEQRLPGVGHMVSTTWTVTDALPRLRVPTNGYLFEMVTTLYLDECKRRHRLKRGGTGLREPPSVDGPGIHPLDALPDESDGQMEEEDSADSDSQAGRSRTPSVDEVPVADFSLQLEHTEFLEKFLDYLRQPVAEAAAACAQAAQRGKATAERHRLESLSAKLDRTLAVLSLMGEGHTQEEAAAELQLSRNQIKYIIEKVQEAYEGFIAPRVTPSCAATDAGAHFHG